ncbi:MAG: hypothetical protein ACNYVW_09495 [Methanosarcinales archaeon]
MKGRISAQGLNPDVVESFKEHVKTKYGKLHTVFGLELQQAIEDYLSKNSTHTHNREPAKNEVPPTKSIGERKLDQAECALNAAGLLEAIQNGGIVYSSAVKGIMQQSVGLDSRTVNKYFDAFCYRNNFEVTPEGALQVFV